jgi:hypothetical protein
MNDHDPTENIRRIQQVVSNSLTDAEIPEETWDTDALQRDFVVLGFMAPYVVVRRKSDDKKGSLQFRHHPRVYFGWKEDSRP